MYEGNVAAPKPVSAEEAAHSVNDFLDAYAKVKADAPTRAFIGKDRWDRMKNALQPYTKPRDALQTLGNSFYGLDIVIDYDDRERLEFK